MNGLSTSGQFNNRPPTPYKINVNNSKFIDFVDKNRVISTTLIALFSNFLRNSSIHFRMFLYLVTCFLRVTVWILYRSQGRTISSSFTNQGQIGTCIYNTACNRYSNETVTLRKYVFKYKNMRKWMIDFSENLRIVALKLLVNSILITKSINLQSFTLILYGFGVRCDLRRFPLLSPLMHILLRFFTVNAYLILYTEAESACSLMQVQFHL